MGQRRIAACAAALALCSARITQNFDFGWKFHLGDDPNYSPAPECDPTQFNITLNGIQVIGLSQASSLAGQSAAACEAAACAASAQVWQWCPPTGCTGGSNNTCWIGSLSGNSYNSTGWISSARSGDPTPFPPFPWPAPENLTCPTDFACPDYDDSSWRSVTLPHDYVDEGVPCELCGDRNHGYLPWNISYYRKTFTIPTEWQGQPIWLDFDGIYRGSDIWLNGVWVGHWESGYAPGRFYIHNVTGGTVNFGGNNVLAVRVDGLTFQEGWFYEGSGIYRHVTINTAPTAFIVPWSLFAPSVVTGTITGDLTGPQTSDSAYVSLYADIQSADSSTSGPFTLTFTITDASGNVIASVPVKGTVNATGWQRVSTSATLANVTLWNLVNPYLYTVNATLVTSAGVDSVTERIGIRSAIFDANQGLLLNGYQQKIQGFSMHQDFAGTGTAVPDRVNKFRMQLLKSVGATGWRTAHNPVNREILDFADELGMLMWLENRNLERQVIGSGVPRPKERKDAIYGPDGTMLLPPVEDTPIDPATFPNPQYLFEAQQLVLRDRNHPSFIIMSLCNEGGCFQGSPVGGIVAQAFKNVILEIDSTRPITANSEDSTGDTLTHLMDVQSFSYNYGEYDTAHRKYPWRAVMGGESASCTSDRSYYGPTNQTTGAVNANDAGCVENAWASAGTRPWVAGNFAWTGLDYKGEPTPTNWPSINSHFGVLDIAGFDKDSTAYYRAWWNNDQSYVGILPSSWNAPVAPGQTINAVVYCACSFAQLWVNGQSYGVVAVPYLGYASFPNVVYQPGNITAVAYDANNKTVGSKTVETTGPAVALALSFDAASGTITADGQDVSIIRLSVVDAQGRVVPDASPVITYNTSGPGDIYGVGNGNPNDHTPDKVGKPDLPYGGVWARPAYGGLGRVLVQSRQNQPGTISLSASAPGLQTATITITTTTASQQE